MGNVPIAILPIPSHGAVFKGDTDTAVGSPLGQRRKNLFEPGNRFGNRFFPHTSGKTGDNVSPKQMSVIDEFLESVRRCAIKGSSFERIAKNTERTDYRARTIQRLVDFPRELLEIGVAQSLPEG